MVNTDTKFVPHDLCFRDSWLLHWSRAQAGWAICHQQLELLFVRFAYLSEFGRFGLHVLVLTLFVVMDWFGLHLIEIRIGFGFF